MRPSTKWCAPVLAVVLAACAHKAAVVVVAPKPKPKPPEVTMAIMPVEGDVFPKLVKALNGELTDATVGGVQRTFVSKVSLEVVQISIECVDPTAACWTAAGKSLNADRLLFAQIEPVAEPKKKKKKSVHLRVTLFDVHKGEAIGDTDHTYKTEDEAVAASRGLLTETLNAATPPAEVKDAPPP
jgi:hypothetical protein